MINKIYTSSLPSGSGLYNDLGGIGIDGFGRPGSEHGPLSNLKLVQVLHQIPTPVMYQQNPHLCHSLLQV